MMFQEKLLTTLRWLFLLIMCLKWTTGLKLFCYGMLNNKLIGASIEGASIEGAS